MKRVSFALLGSLCLLISPLAAADDDDDLARIASEIDRLVTAKWKENDVTPTRNSTDAEFLRRAYLDIAGRIPSVSEVRQFLADKSPDKRSKLIDELVESSAYISNTTVRLRDSMLPEIGSDLQLRFLLPGFDSWLRGKLLNDASYADIVHDILTLKVASNDRMQTFRLAQGQPSPIAFYQAKQIKPENLAAATARTFLGVRIECAQCHDHPFDSWKRNEFWSFAAFFAGLERPNGNQGIFGQIREVRDRREIDIPDTDEVAPVAFLDGTEPTIRYEHGTRKALADWVMSKDNPYFAQAMANRIWQQFFGVGIVDPVDDFGSQNSPSHPEVLSLLATEFAARDFDLKFLTRVITRTKTWQLSSERTHDSQDDPRTFSRMSVRGMRPTQIYNSFAIATGLYQPFQIQQIVAFGARDARSEIFELFSDNATSPNEVQSTILQALSAMNGQGTFQATTLQTGQVLTSIVQYPFKSDDDRVEAMYLATLSRKPNGQELKRLGEYIASGGPDNNKNKAYSDVFWALLNSSEFLFNH